jgi:hypothetical protein
MAYRMGGEGIEPSLRTASGSIRAGRRATKSTRSPARVAQAVRRQADERSNVTGLPLLPPSEHYSTAHVAALLGVTEETVFDLIQGPLDAVRYAGSRQVWIPRAALEAFRGLLC